MVKRWTPASVMRSEEEARGPGICDVCGLACGDFTIRSGVQREGLFIEHAIFCSFECDWKSKYDEPFPAEVLLDA